MNRIIRFGFRKLEIGSIVQHYKGGCYKITGECKNTETEEELVIYHEVDKKGQDQPQIWVSPKKMFFDIVKHEGMYKCRFISYQK